jgi:hypothetical protein
LGSRPTEDEKSRTWTARLNLLAGQTSPRVRATLALELVRIATTVKGKNQIREILLGLLAELDSDLLAAEVTRGIAQLNLSISDLYSQDTQAIRLASGRLAVARRNSALDDWLKALPSLA